VARALDRCPLPEGNRVAIVTNAGGPGIMATDAIVDLGMRIAELSQETRDGLRTFLPAEASVANPVDMIASATAESYAKTLARVLDDPGVDMGARDQRDALPFQPHRRDRGGGGGGAGLLQARARGDDGHRRVLRGGQADAGPAPGLPLPRVRSPVDVHALPLRGLAPEAGGRRAPGVRHGRPGRRRDPRHRARRIPRSGRHLPRPGALRHPAGRLEGGPGPGRSGGGGPGDRVSRRGQGDRPHPGPQERRGSGAGRSAERR
jgi:Ligase-CoA domain